MIRAILVLCLLLTGCAQAVRVELDHTSHPMVGPPFGPKAEEDSVSQVSVVARWQNGHWFTEQGIGYNLYGENGGGFYGPPLTYTGRVGYEIWSKK